MGRVLARYEGIHPEYVVAFVKRRLEEGETISAETFQGHVAASQADDLET